ncbi:MAG: hypothetical protein JNJ54_14685 [Myxococcaceae bacterium]|nr:hypothetical protein [Myxococcaceae bacterium]
MCRVFALSGFLAGLAFLLVTTAATWLFSRDMVDTPRASSGLGFLFGFSGGLAAGAIALVVVFVGALLALWPSGASPGDEKPR